MIILVLVEGDKEMHRPQLFLIEWFLCTFIVFLCCTAAISGSSFEHRVHEGHLCARNSKWYSARDFTLKLEQKGIQGNPSFTVQLMENDDMHIKLDGLVPTVDGSSGEAILIAGRVLLTRNIQIQENYAIDILDGPGLLRQLALTLIGLASEKGPQSATFPIQAKIAEVKYPIKVTTASAGGSYNAPWEAMIDLSKNDKGIIDYKIAFSFAEQQGKKTAKNFTGQLSNYGERNSNKPLTDDFNISNWKQYIIGPYTKKTEKGTIYDYGTTNIEPPLSTLGKLRKYIKEKKATKDGRHNK